MTKTITPTPRRMKNNHTILLFALLLLVSTKMAAVEAFVIPGGVKIIQHGTSEICGIDLMRRTTRTTKLPKTFSSSYLFHLRSVQQDQQQDQEQETSNDNVTTEYERLLLEATKMRLEAEKMDIDLTLKKITILEDKLSNDVWLKKQNGQTVKDLYEQLRRLQMKIDGDTDTNGGPSPLVTIGNKKQNDDETSSSLSSSSTSSSSISTTSINDDVKDNPNNDLANGSKGDDDIVVVEKEKKYSSSSSSSSSSSNNNRNVPPIAGFDNEDLKLYVPVAEDVNRMAPDSSLEERMVLFRDAPELQAHFKEKIQKLLLGPLEEMQELENYKQQYFDSSSSREREALLKQIKRLEKKQEDNNISIGSGDDAASIAANNDNNSGFGFSDKIYIPPEDLPILLDGELEERYETIKALPDILVAVYLQRNGLYNLPVALNTINVDIGRGGIGFNMSIANKTSTTTTSTSENDDKDEDEVNKKLNEVDTVGEDQSTTTTAVSDNTNTDTSSFDLTTAAVSDNDTDASSSFDLYENLKLAIQLDYYDLQIQLLDQARDIQPMTDELRRDFSLAFRSLPVDVRKRFVVNNLRIDKFTDSVLTSNEDNDIEEILNEILKPDDIISPFMQFGSLFDQKAKKNVLVVGNGDEGGGQIQPERPEYNDVEFVDRSRYLEEFFPSVALLEDQRPTQEDVDLFVSECLSGPNKPFMVTSKPERVIGGYYIRGTNQVLNNNKNKDTTTTPTDMLVQEVYKRLQNQPSIKDKIEFYYILDPSPPTDEEMELEVESNPVFLVTTKDPDTMYNLSLPWTKSIVTISGLVSTFLFSVGSCVLNPKINDGIEKALDNASTSGFIDIQWFYDLCLPLYFSLLGILFAHELGHRIAASIHKFEIGLPNVIPSLTTGIGGVITPIKSPPPNNKALFDFSIAGPLSGLTVSLGLHFVGLQLTQQMSLDSNLPVLPVDLARSSSLGGGMIQYFLGKYALLPDQAPGAFVELHPFAISGLIGCIINALAMLPLGHTDGGRISLAMFGRRGAFVAKLFTTLILAGSGLFGLDSVNILILYVVFTLVWQRELDSPIRNEVDELDFSRGLLGIASAILVGLILIPITS